MLEEKPMNTGNLRLFMSSFVVFAALTLLAPSEGAAGVEPSPFLSGISGVGEDDAWAVGEAGSIWHWDGRRWTDVESPTKRDLTAVWVAGPDDAWAVGHGVIINWNGHEWVMGVEPSPFLNAISGINSRDIWAVGDGGVAMHYDGKLWREVKTGFEMDLYGVAGTGPGNVWAVGDGAIIKWNEHEWVMGVEPSPFLNAVWAANAEDVLAVGERGSMLHFDGRRWSEIDSGTEYDLMGVWGSAPDDIWAVGAWGTVLRYDGEEWQVVKSEIERDLNDIWLSKKGAVWAVGDHVIWTPTMEGIPTDPDTGTRPATIPTDPDTGK
jgi:hypothetical protein